MPSVEKCRKKQHRRRFRNVIKCDVSIIKVSHIFNYMIFDKRCPQNIATKVWFLCFIDFLIVEI